MITIVLSSSGSTTETCFGDSQESVIMGHGQCHSAKSLRQVLFGIRAGNSNLAKSLSDKVTMQCTKMKTHTDACYPCTINKTNHFSHILVTSMHKTDAFWLLRFIWDSHIFQKLSFVFAKVSTNIFIFHMLRSL